MAEAVIAGRRLPGLSVLFPGVLIAVTVAMASQFLAEHYGAPAMLLALLLGIALNFLSADPRCKAGIDFASKPILRFGVALLGLRISFDMIAGLGLGVVSLIVGAVVATIAFGLAASRFFGFRYRFAFLSAGSVAICGASAAMAIAAILPKDEKSEERLVFTVVGVTILSTVAMIVYPILSAALSFDDRTAGIYIGATIHDVAQVVGASFSISEEAGETATLVKLLRVAMLAPVVLAATVIIRMTATDPDPAGKRPALLPGFVAAFVLLAVIASVVPLPREVTDAAGAVSRWALLIAIAAVGMKTQPKDMLKVGGAAAALLLAETLFLAVLVGGALHLMIQ